MATIQTKRRPRRWIRFPALFLIGILALAFAPNAQAQVWTSHPLSTSYSERCH